MAAGTYMYMWMILNYCLVTLLTLSLSASRVKLYGKKRKAGRPRNQDKGDHPCSPKRPRCSLCDDSGQAVQKPPETEGGAGKMNQVAKDAACVKKVAKTKVSSSSVAKAKMGKSSSAASLLKSSKQPKGLPRSSLSPDFKPLGKRSLKKQRSWLEDSSSLQLPVLPGPKKRLKLPKQWDIFLENDSSDVERENGASNLPVFDFPPPKALLSMSTSSSSSSSCRKAGGNKRKVKKTLPPSLPVSPPSVAADKPAAKTINPPFDMSTSDITFWEDSDDDELPDLVLPENFCLSAKPTGADSKEKNPKADKAKSSAQHKTNKGSTSKRTSKTIKKDSSNKSRQKKASDRSGSSSSSSTSPYTKIKQKKSEKEKKSVRGRNGKSKTAQASERGSSQAQQTGQSSSDIRENGQEQQQQLTNAESGESLEGGEGGASERLAEKVEVGNGAACNSFTPIPRLYNFLPDPQHR